MRGPWDALERATLDTCEPDVAGWLVHPVETVSALVYLAVALVIWRGYGDPDRRLHARHLPAILAVIGFGAALFHASFAAIFHALDLAVIYLFAGYMLAAMLVHRGHLGRPNFARVFLLAGVGGGLLPFIHVWVGFGGLALETLVVLWMGRIAIPDADHAAYRTAVRLLLPGVALLMLDHGGIGCVRGPLEHAVQPHAVWHVLSAASFYFLYRYERALEQRWLQSDQPA